jgi:diacylglycerol kinase family enzyme
MRRIQIIVNNGAGTGKAHRVWNETQCLLRGYKIKYEAHMTRYEGHAAKLADFPGEG